jgi:hypothetical protein
MRAIKVDGEIIATMSSNSHIGDPAVASLQPADDATAGRL